MESKATRKNLAPGRTHKVKVTSSDVQSSNSDHELGSLVALQQQQQEVKIRLSDNTSTLVNGMSAPFKFDGGMLTVVIRNPRNTITKNLTLQKGEASLVTTVHGLGKDS